MSSQTLADLHTPVRTTDGFGSVDAIRTIAASVTSETNHRTFASVSQSFCSHVSHSSRLLKVHSHISVPYQFRASAVLET
jgi:hypothetical protein